MRESRRIAVITGTRAEYGILRPVLNKIKESRDLELKLIVTGSHLSPVFGETISEIKKDGFKITAAIDSLEKEDTGKGMAKSLGRFIVELVDSLDSIDPGFLLLLGDRWEMLGGAAAAAYLNIPIAHIHGGEISGTVDEPVRHAITKLAHIHFPATEQSASRIIRMGEEPWRVLVSGAPALDTILSEKLVGSKELSERYGFDLKEPLILLVQHPVTTEVEEAEHQIKETLNSVADLGHQTIIIYPNADAGGRRMIRGIEEYAEKYPFIKAFKNLRHIDYISLMKTSSVMVGNSSSGIIEAPSFHLPVVNIGIRQQGRQRAENIIDVGHDKEEIKNAINKALYDKDFRSKVQITNNPYGDGKAAGRIIDKLKNTVIDKKLIQKRMTY